MFSVCYILTQHMSALRIFNDSALYKFSLNNNNNNNLMFEVISTLCICCRHCYCHDKPVRQCLYGQADTRKCLRLRVGEWQGRQTCTVSTTGLLQRLAKKQTV